MQKQLMGSMLQDINERRHLLPGEPINLPVFNPQKAAANAAPRVGIVAAINSSDPNGDYELSGVDIHDTDLFDNSSYAGEINEFLGINFKKIGKTLGKVFKTAGKFGLFGAPGMIIANRLKSRNKSSFNGQKDAYDMDAFNPVQKQNYRAFLASLTPSERQQYDDFVDIGHYTTPIQQYVLARARKMGVGYVPGMIVYNRLTSRSFSSFAGDSQETDLQGLSPATLILYKNFLKTLNPKEYAEYSSFLGINFKKIGSAIGKAVGAVGKAVGGAAKAVGKTVGKVGKWTGQTVARGAKFAVKTAGKGISLAAQLLASQAGLDGGVTDPGIYAGGGGGLGADFDPNMYNQQPEEEQQAVDPETGAPLTASVEGSAAAAAPEDQTEVLGVTIPASKSRIALWLGAGLAVIVLSFYLYKHK